MIRHGGHIFHEVVEVKCIEQEHPYGILIVRTEDFQTPYMIGHN